MKHLLLLFSLYLPTSVMAQNQKVLTLEQCIDIAINKNLQVQQAKIQERTNNVYWNSAKMNMLPDLIGSASSGINTGRNIDPSTNAYVSQQIKFSGYGLSTGLVLFNGLALQQTAAQDKLFYEASSMDWQQQKNNITLNIILAYLQVLSNEDLLAQSVQQSELSLNQVRRLQTLNSEGAIAPYLLTDLQGQYANDRLAIINARNQAATARINLFRLMNIPYADSVKVARIDTAQVIRLQPATPLETYSDALKSFALIKANDLRAAGAEHGVRAAKGQYFPLLTFNGNANTTYSSGTIKPYKEQLDNNLFSSFALNLTVPIFNRSFYRNNVRLAKLILENNKAVASSSKTALQQDVYQAHANLQAAAEKYATLLDQAKAYNASFKSAEIRFNEGVINSIDYLIAKNNIDRTNIDLIAAKYDYALRQKVLDYYSGTLNAAVR
jgi:outer membrane protein